MSHRNKLLTLLALLSLFLVSCSSTKLEAPATEGEELKILLGIKDEHWNIVNNIIVEVNNINDRLNKVIKLLKKYNFKLIKVIQEKELQGTTLYNVIAHRTKKNIKFNLIN